MGDVVGRYRIVGQLGSGGMGVVFDAVNLDTDGKAALKWLHPSFAQSSEAAERFRREARATGRIQHPNVVAIHGVGEQAGAVYLVMERLRGESLASRLSRGKLEVEEAVRIMLQVMRGVAAAHEQGILHRDLKPENIFLATDPDHVHPIAKVLDFGIAKLLDVQQGESVTAATGALGTYQYMAFEQLHLRKDLDARVDVYALGVVLYRALTGHLPFDAQNPIDLALQMTHGCPAPARDRNPAIPAELSDLVQQAVSTDREQRFRSVEAFAATLEPFSGGARFRTGPIGATSSPSWTPAPIDSPADTQPIRRSSRQPRPASSSPARWARRRTAIVVVLATSAMGFALWLAIRAPKAIPVEARPSASSAQVTPTASPQRAPQPKPDTSNAATEQNQDWATPEPVHAASPEPSAPAPHQEGSSDKARPATAKGELMIVVVPFGEVWLDGKSLGPAPVTARVPPGPHVIGVGDGRPSVTRSVHVQAGGREQVVVRRSRE